MEDRDYMALALELAERGAGWTCPNPMVGAVIVKDGRIIGQGYHQRCGALHAEREALAACQSDPCGATLYVTLEPCCHQGRQPPCVDAILAAGIRRVVVGCTDPNPLVGGRGIALLREHGVVVAVGVMEEACRELNRFFFHYILTHRPYVVMKYAMTMDGKIAAYTGDAKWITGEAAREHVHRLRHRCRGILVGVGTVLADDPMLNCRLPGGRDPVRIICDTHLRTPLTARVVTTAGEIPTILATCETAPGRCRPYEAAGCRVLTLPAREGRVDLGALLDQLGGLEMDSLLLEGGGGLNESMLRQGLVHKVYCYLAPKLFGGAQAKSPVEGRGVDRPEDCWQLSSPTCTPIGEDLLLEYEVIQNVHRDH